MFEISPQSSLTPASIDETVVKANGIVKNPTIIAAIIAKAGAKGTLYPVLSFPILLPLILTCVQLTLFSFDGTSFEEAQFEVAIVVGYDVIMLTASYMLFDFIWKD